MYFVMMSNGDFKNLKQYTSLVKIKLNWQSYLDGMHYAPNSTAFFAEAAALMIDVEYESEPEGYINLSKKFAIKYKESDVWNCEKLGFVFLDKVHELTEAVASCKDCAEAKIMFRDFSEKSSISSGHYENIPLSLAKQLYTCRQLIQELGNANCIFLSCIRQLFTVTKYEAMISM